MEEYIDESGQIDFDKLNAVEREVYLKALKDVASAQITLEDWKKYIIGMRESVENAMLNEPEYIYSEILPFLKRTNPKIAELKARFKNYLIFERFLSKPEKAKQQIDIYNKRLGIK